MAITRRAVGRYPSAWARLTSFYFELGSASSYEEFYVKGKRILFSTGPLSDHRGIGRVSKFYYEILKAANQRAYEEQKTIYFYSSIHWCPAKVAKNSIVVIHDVIPLVLPNLFDASTKQIWLDRRKKIACQAGRILTISQTSANDIHKYLGICRSKISVIYNGVSKFPQPTEVVLPSFPYLVYVGAVDKHKNLEVVVNALLDSRLFNVGLVLIGLHSNSFTEIITNRLSGRSIIMGPLSDDKLAFIISRSIALVYPSLYEGFGLPPLEAAALGVRSICADRPAMNELLDRALFKFCSPDNPNEWSDAIQYYLENVNPHPEHLEGFVDQHYSWDSVRIRLLSEIENFEVDLR